VDLLFRASLDPRRARGERVIVRDAHCKLTELRTQLKSFLTPQSALTIVSGALDEFLDQVLIGLRE
jgi:hypothetical protein